MRRSFLSLVFLLLAAGASDAQVVLGEAFLADGPRAFPVEIDSVAARPDLADAAAAREAAAAEMSEDVEFVVVSMLLGRAAADGYDTLTLARDADGVVRFAEYLVDGREDRVDERRRHRVRLLHLFDADGRTAEVRASSTHQPERACGGGVFSTVWEVTVAADGRALAFERRDATYGGPQTPSAPPEACVSPVAFAPILAYPTADALLAGLRVTPESLDWRRPEAPPAAPPPPPPPSR